MLALDESGKVIVALILQEATDHETEQAHRQPPPEDGSEQQSSRCVRLKQIIDGHEDHHDGADAPESEQAAFEEFVPTPLSTHLVERVHQTGIGFHRTHGSPLSTNRWRPSERLLSRKRLSVHTR